MPVPKRRTSATRRDKRRANWKQSSGSVSTCPQCGEPRIPHRICKHCGFYDGRMVAKPAEE